MLEFVQKGYWMLLPYWLVRQLKHLQVSPMGIVPQRDRRPCLIVDYTFYGLNVDTVPLSSRELMQFGCTLERILYHVRHANPCFGPVYLSKVDLSDGFYRIGPKASAILKLGIAFPKYAGEEQMIAFPLGLPMGWVKSPPYFCAATETVTNLANMIPKNMTMPEHPMEVLADTCPASEEQTEASSPKKPGPLPTPIPPSMPPVLRPYQQPVDAHNVYMDDFCSAIQGNPQQHRQHKHRLLHSIDAVFCPADSLDPPNWKPVPSEKKCPEGMRAC